MGHDPPGNSKYTGQSVRYPRRCNTLQVDLCMSFKFSIFAAVLLTVAGHSHAEEILRQVEAHDWELTVEIRLSSEVPIQLGPDGRPMGIFRPDQLWPYRPPWIDGTRWANVKPNGFFDTKGGRIRMPFVEESASSKAAADRLDGLLFIGTRQDKSAISNGKVLPVDTLGERAVEFALGEGRDSTMRWSITLPQRTYAVVVDEARASALPWPRSMSSEGTQALKPSGLIDSDDPVFLKAVEKISGDRLQVVSPWVAAKSLLAGVIRTFRVGEPATARGRSTAIRGIVARKASEAAKSDVLNPVEDVMVAVGVLRAAGLPARSVHGVRYRGIRRPPEPVTWGEWFHPDLGWIPFDMEFLRGDGVINRSPKQRWRGFGEIRELERRIPIAFRLHPESDARGWYPWAWWSWEGMAEHPEFMEQAVELQMLDRGRVPNRGLTP